MQPTFRQSPLYHQTEGGFRCAQEESFPSEFPSNPQQNHLTLLGLQYCSEGHCPPNYFMEDESPCFTELLAVVHGSRPQALWRLPATTMPPPPSSVAMAQPYDASSPAEQFNYDSDLDISMELEDSLEELPLDFRRISPRSSDFETVSSGASTPTASLSLSGSSEILTMYTVDFVGEKSFVCPVDNCRKQYRYKGDLKAHTLRRHPNIPYLPGMISKPKSSNIDKEHPCPILNCRCGYKTKKDLSRHMRNKHQIRGRGYRRWTQIETVNQQMRDEADSQGIDLLCQ